MKPVLNNSTPSESPLYGRALRWVAVLSVILAFLPASASATAVEAGDSAPRLIGAQGELLTVHNGRYGELFPQGVDADPRANVLALDVVAGESSERLLVPGTASIWSESSVSLISDERAGVSYLLWESRVNGVHPLLRLVSFDGQAWGQVKEITASVFASKGEPQLRVTHDTHGEGEGQLERTVLHVSWWEDHQGVKEKRYASLISENGEFVDADALIDLSALLQREGSAFAPSSLDSSIRMQAGPHKDVVIMGFTDPSSASILGLQIEVLPQPLSRLSDRIRGELESLDEFAGPAAAVAAVERAIDEVASEFHPVGLELIRQDLLTYLAQQLIENPGSDHPLGVKIGGRVIWIGAKIGRTGLENPGEPQLVEIAGPEGKTHHIALTQVASWSIPEIGDQPELFLSRDGSGALIAWPSPEGDAVVYRMTDGDREWGKSQRLALQPGIDLTQAMELLERKALER